VYEFSFSVFEGRSIGASPIHRDARGFVQYCDVLSCQFTRRAEVSVVNEAVTPADEDANGLEAAEKAVDGNKEDYD
jgi:hypothetical protein